MGWQGQMALLVKLHDLETTLKKKRGKEKKEVENRINRVCSLIDAWALKHYRRHKEPFGEFRNRTCSACGMVYPRTHVHCRPDTGEVRLCEGCGRILLAVVEEDMVAGDQKVLKKTTAKTKQKARKTSPTKGSKPKRGSKKR